VQHCCCWSASHCRRTGPVGVWGGGGGGCTGVSKPSGEAVGCMSLTTEPTPDPNQVPPSHPLTPLPFNFPAKCDAPADVVLCDKALPVVTTNQEAPHAPLPITHPMQHSLVMQVVHGCCHLQCCEPYGPQVRCACEGVAAGAEPPTHHSILGGGAEGSSNSVSWRQSHSACTSRLLRQGTEVWTGAGEW
jgi:hypothetical protein